MWKAVPWRAWRITCYVLGYKVSSEYCETPPDLAVVESGNRSIDQSQALPVVARTVKRSGGLYSNQSTFPLEVLDIV